MTIVADTQLDDAERFYRVLAQMNIQRQGVMIGPHLNAAYLP